MIHVFAHFKYIFQLVLRFVEISFKMLLNSDVEVTLLKLPCFTVEEMAVQEARGAIARK